MNDLLYNVLSKYYNTLNKIGYINDYLVYNILVYTFIVNYITHDYRGLISKEDYNLFSEVLYKLFGTDCLIPYPEYEAMINLGNLNELTTRIKNVEKSVDKINTTEVLKTSSGNMILVPDIRI